MLHRILPCIAQPPYRQAQYEYATYPPEGKGGFDLPLGGLCNLPGKAC